MRRPVKKGSSQPVGIFFAQAPLRPLHNPHGRRGWKLQLLQTIHGGDGLEQRGPKYLLSVCRLRAARLSAGGPI